MRPKILICDDEEVLRQLVRASLARSDYDIVEACDGDEAVTSADVERPQLIILDMMMPRRTGLEVLEHIRANPHLAATPVIMLTARTQKDDRDAADVTGATVFLAKPFSPTDLAFLVARTLATPAPPACFVEPAAA
jgi:two-component system phosphate regulon response regulator PhoB